jgi:DivIVA domain-containing protein
LPEDIESKQFVVRMRGWDPDEVASFLKAIADDYRELATAVQHDREAVAAEAEGTVAAARAEAERIVAAAKKQADELIAGGRREVDDALRRSAHIVQETQTVVDRDLAEAETRMHELVEGERALVFRLEAAELALRDLREGLRGVTGGEVNNR